MCMEVQFFQFFDKLLTLLKQQRQSMGWQRTTKCGDGKGSG